MTHQAERVPASGFETRRGAAALMLATMLGATGASAGGHATTPRIAYPRLSPSDIVMLAGRAQIVPGPRVADPLLPADARIAPDDFLLDSDEAEPAGPAPAAPAADVLALARLAQNYRPRPALWRVRRRGGTLYLFGTIHVLPPGFRWRSAAVTRAVAASHALIVEAVSDDAPAVISSGARPPPLALRVSPDHRRALAHFTDTLPPGAVAELDAMPTWMAAIAVGYVRDIQAGETPGPGADDWLEATFRAAGKPVVPVEDGAQVMAQIGGVAEDAQRRLLDTALDTPAAPRAAQRAPAHAWARGEIGPGSALAIDLDHGSRSALDRPLLLDRNRAWADTLARRLELPGTALFAAGIGHFIGPDSVIALLRKRGLRVERVD